MTEPHRQPHRRGNNPAGASSSSITSSSTTTAAAAASPHHAPLTYHAGIPSPFQAASSPSAASTSSPSTSTHAQQSRQSTPQPTPQPAPQPPRIRRRNRLITSCLECRRRKLKCDKAQPCGNCVRFGRACVFLAPALDPAARLRLAELKEKQARLERKLEEDVARSASAAATAATAAAAPEAMVGGLKSEEGEEGRGVPMDDGRGKRRDDGRGEEDEEAPEDERDLEAARYATEDAAYGDDGDDDLVDLGVQLGKMRITERIGGFVRPKFSEELTDILKDMLGGDIPSHRNAMSYQMHGPDYVAPSSAFLFASVPHRGSLMHFLPSKSAADKLVLQYWDAVHPVARCLHRPTFEAQYALYWNQIAMGVEPRMSFQAIVFAVLLSAVISLPEEKVLFECGANKAELVDSFKSGTEAALCKANFLRTTKLETMQAFVMYLIPLCRSEVSRAHSALTGMAIRLAECMGLHRDGELYGLSPVETHVRRLVWYQLCFLDIRTCDATGPRPQIQAEDYDTKFPLNVNDIDFMGSTPPTTDSDHFTDMTLSRIRFECNEITRMIWVERRRVERKQTTLTALLRRVEDIRAEMEKKYLPMLDTNNNPLHYFTLHVFAIASRRWHIAILHRYSSTPYKIMPPRLRNFMLASGCLVLEHAMLIETHPALRRWAWYAGALQQYHIAMLLLSEMYTTRLPPQEEARIWRVLDFAFELPPHMEPVQKARMVVSELRDRTEFYQSLRKMRAPVGMGRAPGERESAARNRNREAHAASTLRRRGFVDPAPSDDGNRSTPSPVHASQPQPQTQPPPPPHTPQPTTATSAAAGTDGRRALAAAFAFAATAAASSASGLITPPLQTDPHHRAPAPAPTSSPSTNNNNNGAHNNNNNNNNNNHATSNSGNSGWGLATGAPFYGPTILPPHPSAGFSPHQQNHHHASGYHSSSSGPASPAALPGLGGNGEMRLDIDWDEWDKLFPPDLHHHTIDPTIPPFGFGGVGSGTYGGMDGAETMGAGVGASAASQQQQSSQQQQQQQQRGDDGMQGVW